MSTLERAPSHGTSQRWEAKVEVDDPQAAKQIGRAISDCTDPLLGDGRDLIVLCIGTDRSTGDALGPLVGTMLQEQGLCACHVYGTLDAPVHASNLQQTLDLLTQRHHRPVVVAVDACLGRVESVGTITVGRGALRPGAGVNKNLPSVGEVFITGVVNVGGFMEYFVLQNTRLSLVVRMARAIAEGFCRAVEAHQDGDAGFAARAGTASLIALGSSSNSTGARPRTSPSAW